MLHLKDALTRSVMAGLVPAISIPMARLCQTYRDARDKPGHDGYK
jgi:hypothetical protein